MNQLSRNKVLLTIIAVLLIANVVMLYLFFTMCKAPTDKKGPGFTERLKTEVGFTPDQMAVFEPKKKAFWSTMHHKFEDIKSTKVEFYNYMYDPAVPDSVMEAHAGRIGKQQQELDLFVIRHFKDVRKLCTPEQLPKYDSLLPGIVQRMVTRPSRK